MKLWCLEYFCVVKPHCPYQFILKISIRNLNDTPWNVVIFDFKGFFFSFFLFESPFHFNQICNFRSSVKNFFSFVKKMYRESQLSYKRKTQLSHEIDEIICLHHLNGVVYFHFHCFKVCSYVHLFLDRTKEEMNDRMLYTCINTKCN